VFFNAETGSLFNAETQRTQRKRREDRIERFDLTWQGEERIPPPVFVFSALISAFSASLR
jgi:hypothetical protein